MTKSAKSSIRKHSLAMVLVMLMLVICGSVTAYAEADDQITYLRREWNGTEVVSTIVTEDIPAVPSNGSMTSGKYFLGSMSP